MKPFRLLTMALSVLGILFLSSAVWCQVTKLDIAYVSDSPASLPAWIAKEAGLFNNNGLDVQLPPVATAVALMALFSGQLSIIQAAGSVVIESNLKGSGAVYVACGTAILDYILISQPEIKTASQLKGGALGVSSLSGSAIVATHFALRKIGLADPYEVNHLQQKRKREAEEPNLISRAGNIGSYR